ncbi:ABC transporter substrate-binding protein [Brumimicrobium aurantiacum]|uniref:ABC transporter substrate-binding protein n=1 Tax=Brumimicrobium aurantiacum TaxID=1737063 RepID=A0A3E1EVK6_9FLAO|nr:ABC transporter substrate-binding protein [Brumimicrobium aurantiacum]RFC53552.1 ABC transporter substrate-binding protein [Brumimicrobium aurantiacum]
MGHTALGKLLTFLLFSILFACTSENKEEFKFEGGTLNYAIDRAPFTDDLRSSYRLNSALLYSQIFEGLVALDPKTLKTKPGLAEEWQISPDGKFITFILKDSVYFHQNNKQKEKIPFTAEDVVFSIEQSCTKTDKNQNTAYFLIFKDKLKGANDFYNKVNDHITGLKASGNSIQLELLERDVNFLPKLSLPMASIVSKEAFEDQKELIGTGPFQYNSQEKDDQEKYILVRNENYHEVDQEGNTLPYLDSIVFHLIPDKLEQLKMFKSGKLHLIENIPPHEMSAMLGEENIEKFNGIPPKYLLTREPLYSTQYYYFDFNDSLFHDINLRKAINLAINRDEIISTVLNNQAIDIDDSGLIPNGIFNGYNTEIASKNNYVYDAQKAKQFFRRVESVKIDKFPTIVISPRKGSTNFMVAQKIAEQLAQTLNIEVEVKTNPSDTSHVIAQAPQIIKNKSPESYLTTANSHKIPEDSRVTSLINFSKYSNEKYDMLLSKGRKSKDIVARYDAFEAAESELMKNPPYIILWHNKKIKIQSSALRNFEINELERPNFKKVYIKEWTAEEWQQQKKD